MILPLIEPVKHVLQVLQSQGFEAFVVGGSIRDLLRGISPKDWDVTTSATPIQMKQIFSEYKVIETGLKHGTLTVVIEQVPIEVTTYRLDSSYSDFRHPDNIIFTTSLKEDLSRRDFTMNALAYNPTIGLVDYFDGQNDIKNGVIRAVGDPNLRLQEDALRSLRALRFAATFGFTLEKNLKNAILQKAVLLKHISGERIRDEMGKLVMGSHASSILINYETVWSEIFTHMDSLGKPSVSPLREKSVLIWNNLPEDLILRWTLFFLFLMPMDNSSRQLNLVKGWLERLKFDTASSRNIMELIALFVRPIPTDEKEIKQWLKDHSVKVFQQLLELRKSIDAEEADQLSNYRQIESQIALIIQSKVPLHRSQLAINGNDLKNLGFSGVEIQICLDKTLDHVLFDGYPNDKTMLLKWIKTEYVKK